MRPPLGLLACSRLHAETAVTEEDDGSMDGAWNDVTGKALDPDLVRQARREELEYFKKMKVYSKVPRSEVAKHGCKVITTRWLDVNRGDATRPNYRAMLVGRELNTHKRHDFWCNTCPLCVL